MERNPGNIKEESEEISNRSNDSSNSQQHSSSSCLQQEESEDQEDGNRHESEKQEETSTRRKRDEISSTDNNNCNMNDENDERECSICGHSIPVMNFDIHFSNCQRRRHSQTSRNMITSSGNTRSTRRTNGTSASSNSHVPARTTLNVSSNLYNDSLQCKEEENNDERKPAARSNIQESGETNDQAIHIDDSMEIDDTPDSPPRQRPRYINHRMNTRSRTTRNSSAGQRITELRQTSSSDDDCIDIATLPNYSTGMSNDEVINLANTSSPTRTTTTTTTARTRSFTSRTSGPELIDLTSSPEKPSVDNQTEQHQNSEWACPRCTLLNAQTDRRCDACNLPRPDAPNDNDSPDGNLRSPDTSFRDRLIDPTSSSASIRLTTRDHARSQALLNEFLNHLSPQQPPRPPRRGLMDSVGQHAILGSAVGAVSAIGGMGGGRSSNVLGSTLQGAVAGAVGGGISQGIANMLGLRNNNSRRHSDTSRVTRSASRNRNDTDIDHDAPSESNRPELPESLRRLGRSYRTFNGPGFRVVMMDGSLPQDQVQQLQAQGMGVHLVRLQQGTHPVDGMNYERLLELFGDGSENRSTDPEVIRSLPSSTIVDVEKEVPKDRRQCCICLDEFENGQNRKTLQCLHGFHEECIDKWLKGSRNCPICKFDVQGSA